MASRSTPYKYLLLTGISLILVTCSVEKNTDRSRFYHGLTARYNIYFNGYESFKAGLTKIRNSYRDDFAEILNVFESSDPEVSKIASSDMERAIQKASKLISLKSITSKPDIKAKHNISEKEKKLLDRKEYNEWVDDSYLLIGKARFHKHEFIEAEAVFNYCITEANDPLIKAEATIWLARLCSETKKFNESLRLLNELEITKDFTKQLRWLYYASLADLFIKQKRYSEAIDPLRKSIELAYGKRTGYRLTYLLAQLLEQTGDGSGATSLYRKVVKMNPPYEVEFNARINIAGVFDINTGNPREIRKELEKMLRDSKNKDFQDQIYFALGNLSMKEGKDAEALDYYRKSSLANSPNQNQKGRSYLSLANYFYDKRDYVRAGTYFDSAVFFLDLKHPGYVELKAKSKNLNDLVSHLVIIEREDSLQRVAGMSESERNVLITSLISNAVKDQSEGKQASDYADRYNIGQYYENERRFQGNIEQEGKWYFYNQAALTFGRTEFRRRWGNRKPDDNWRRSNRAKTNTPQPSSETIVAEAASDTSEAVIDYKSPKFYLQNLPLTDTLRGISNEKIANALLASGIGFYEKISDKIKATETLESLISRFPENTLIPEALYNLYRINKDGNNAKSEAYRQLLIQKYPGSEFARILSDPEYYKKKTADLKMYENLYREAYEAYNSERFNDAISLTNKTLEEFPQNPMAPKFMLLHSYSIAKISDERSFKEDLNKLIEKWPETSESKRAQELVAYLNNKVPELKIEEDKVIAQEIYVSDTTLSRTFVLIISDPAFNINQATFDVISYNIDNYTNKNYRTEGTLVDNKYIMISVSGFQNFSQALNYFMAFNAEKLVRNSTASGMMSFIISDENLKSMLKDNTPGRYELFFRDNYLK